MLSKSVIQTVATPLSSIAVNVGAENPTFASVVFTMRPSNPVKMFCSGTHRHCQ